MLRKSTAARSPGNPRHNRPPGALARLTLALVASSACRPSESREKVATVAATPTVAQPTTVTAEVPLRPILDERALAARVAAQRAALGDAAPLFEDEHGRAVPWITPIGPMADEPNLEDELLDSLPGSSGLGGAEAPSGPRVNGNMLGLFEPIDGATAAQPLERFHQALRGLEARRDTDGKVRVLVYGASHTEADIYPHYLRSYLRDRFGDGGHGFVQVAQPWSGYSHVEVAVTGFDHWSTAHALRRDERDDGLFGLLGASIATRNKRAVGRVAPIDGVVASRFELSFLRRPRGGSFELFVDGRHHATVRTAGKSVEAGFYTFAVPEARHTIEIQPVGDGEIRMFGLTMERDQPGVVVDTLGIRGTRASSFLSWDENVWAASVRRRAPDLMIMAFGTNEAVDSSASMGDYEAQLHTVLDRLARAAPEAACLLIGPGDFPLPLPDGTFSPRPVLASIIDVQRQVAAGHGCGFWDLQAFMGGELSMLQWVRSDPPMARPDHIHLTRRGYVRMGMALADALMDGFDRRDPLTDHR